ncbi:TlpA family protein disulfide reductase [Chryseobacterium sp. G0201]|uniref:TlpA family protein disulfide reductase n=1 Tax=Chryseobacterium sp. G0201 TaxID=2487065 RepID=UPI000F4D2FE1|nr:TlpA disulfide reductase family protein [Chryseobacterium sp. G0201]AZA54551.1 TlpA family protein disulfide reductase [Chryseobacterium sp. G0201]
MMKNNIINRLTTVSFVFCIISSYSLSAQTKSSKKPVVIYGQINADYETAKKKFVSDTITVSFWQTYTKKGRNFPEPFILKTVTKKGNFFGAYGQYVFNFTIPDVFDTGYIRIESSKDVLLKEYLVEPGDSIKILFDQRYRRTVFAGPSAKKFQLISDLEQADASKQFQMDRQVLAKKITDILRTDSLIQAYKINSKNSFGNMFEIKFMYSPQYLEQLGTEISKKPSQLYGWNIFTRYEGLITPKAYSILQANVVGDHLSVALSYFNQLYKAAQKDKKTQLLDSLNQMYYDVIEKIPDTIFSDSIIVASSSYTYVLLAKAHIQSKVQNISTYEILKKNYGGILREKLVVAYFIENSASIDNVAELMSDAFTYFKTEVFKDVLRKLYDASKIGSKAYNFALKDTKGNVVKLSDFKGKIVFIDFWYTGCSSCSKFYTAHLSKVEAHYKDDPNFVFLSISCDKDLSKWHKSINEGLYTSKHTLNLYTNGQGSNHPILSEYGVYGYPSQVLIDRKGKIIQRANLYVPYEKLVPIIDSALAK